MKITFATSTALAALLFGVPPLSQAQAQTAPTQVQPGQAPSQQAGSEHAVIVGQLRTSEQALRQAQVQLSGGQQPNIPLARTAVDASSNVLARVPQEMQGQDAFRTALRELQEARHALQGDQTNQQLAATQLREAADAVGALAGRMTGRADAGTTGQQAVSPPGQGTAGQVVVLVPVTRISNLPGTDLIGPTGDKVGEIENLLIDRDGNVRAVVVEWGGFLGIGQKQRLVQMDQIQLGSGPNDRARISLTREQMEALPAYDRDRLADYGRQYGWGDGLRWHR